MTKKGSARYNAKDIIHSFAHSAAKGTCTCTIKDPDDYENWCECGFCKFCGMFDGGANGLSREDMRNFK